MERCHECNKKALVIVTCRCGEKFCLKHRHSESHKCTYNYSESAKEILNKKLYKIETDKITNRI